MLKLGTKWTDVNFVLTMIWECNYPSTAFISKQKNNLSSDFKMVKHNLKYDEKSHKANVSASFLFLSPQVRME